MDTQLQEKSQISVKPLANFRSLVADDLKRVDTCITDLTKNSKAPLIHTLAEHLLKSGGKRLRPALTLISANLCGYEGEQHIRLAASVEFIHTATLLHDDVVDESDLRRGKATANNLWGSKASILVGDFLLSQSFILMVGSGSLEVLKILADSASVISEGEVLQLMAANDIAMAEKHYLDIITAKTARLFSSASEIGAVIAGETKERQQALQDFGQYLGIAFQIVDDLLDYSAKQEELGKEIGDDFREGKITLPVIHAYRKGSEEEQNFWKRVMEGHDQQDDDFAKALTLIQQHQALESCMAEAKAYVTKAEKSLASFPDSKEKMALLELLAFSVERPY